MFRMILCIISVNWSPPYQRVSGSFLLFSSLILSFTYSKVRGSLIDSTVALYKFEKYSFHFLPISTILVRSFLSVGQRLFLGWRYASWGCTTLYYSYRRQQTAFLRPSHSTKYLPSHEAYTEHWTLLLWMTFLTVVGCSWAVVLSMRSHILLIIVIHINCSLSRQATPDFPLTSNPSIKLPQ